MKIPKRKSVREYYDKQDVFEESKKCINYVFGLELTLIEQVRLKESIDNIFDDLDKIRDLNDKKNKGKLVLGEANEYEATGEIITRFMMDYYGLPFDFARVHTSLPREVDLYRYHQEEFKEYMRLLQERMHLP